MIPVGDYEDLVTQRPLIEYRRADVGQRVRKLPRYVYVNV